MHGCAVGARGGGGVEYQFVGRESTTFNYIHITYFHGSYLCEDHGSFMLALHAHLTPQTVRRIPRYNFTYSLRLYICMASSRQTEKGFS